MFLEEIAQIFFKTLLNVFKSKILASQDSNIGPYSIKRLKSVTASLYVHISFCDKSASHYKYLNLRISVPNFMLVSST